MNSIFLNKYNFFFTEATDMFIKPRSINVTSFWLFHPHQPKTNIPFRPSKLYNRKDGSHRKWISYCVKKKALFCNICLCYGDGFGSFSKGFSVWRHVYERVSDHEETITHKLNVDAHLMKKQFSSVDSLLTHGLGSIRKIQVENNRNVLLRLIDVLKLIGKRGLSYRGKTNKAAYSLDDSSLDHGNFLEITLLISKYDSLLKSHLDKVVKKSLKCHNSGAQQGGGQVTFLSKTTINYILEIIAKNIKFTISNEVKDAVIYSVQLDTTQDISVTDQCSIILRYVNGTSVFERLVGMVRCSSSKGSNFVELLLKVLKDMNLDPKCCIGNATDGAANMQGVYNGFSTKMSEAAVEQVHIWCYAHVLNLVISDITSKIVQSISLFGILQGCAVFIRESYKRMDIWTTKNSKKKICTIGETRWWSKDAALTKVFGHFNEPENGLYVDLITTLDEIENNLGITPDARFKAKNLKEGLLKYETILTAQMYLRIFKKTTPLSKYLQGHGVNIIAAYKMVKQTLNDLQDVPVNFNV